MNWIELSKLDSWSFRCGWCNNLVASNLGYLMDGSPNWIYICPHCEKPTYRDLDRQVPGIAPGNAVTSVPESVNKLYEEARNAVSASAYTAAVLACRKLLMNIAVSQGADENQSFAAYVKFLAEQGYVPPNGQGWVDHIRNKGNEATHEIDLMGRDDAVDLITFAEMLLKFIYEFPSRVPKPRSAG